MPRRQILNARQRAKLFDLPTDQETLLRHYTLADDDIEHIQSRRRARNRFGFALQLCAFRYPGRFLVPGEVIPSEITEFLAAQLGLNPNDLADYAHRAETRREHLADLRSIYGYSRSAIKAALRLRSCGHAPKFAQHDRRQNPRRVDLS